MFHVLTLLRCQAVGLPLPPTGSRQAAAGSDRRSHWQSGSFSIEAPSIEHQEQPTDLLVLEPKQLRNGQLAAGLLVVVVKRDAVLSLGDTQHPIATLLGWVTSQAIQLRVTRVELVKRTDELEIARQERGQGINVPSAKTPQEVGSDIAMCHGRGYPPHASK